MKKIALFALLSGTCAYAAFPTVQVENMSGRYEDKKGVAFAHFASYDLDVVKVRHKELEVNLNNQDKNLVISDLNTTVRLKMDFSFLNVFKSLSFDSASLVSRPKSLALALEELRVRSNPGQYLLSDIQINSDLGMLEGSGTEMDIIEGLVANGNISVASISLDAPAVLDTQMALLNQIPEIAAEAGKVKKEEKGLEGLLVPLVCRNLKLTIEEGNFAGFVLLDSWLNLWLRLGGDIAYDKKANLMEIGLKRARLGIFSVRGFLLGSVRKLGLEAIYVKDDKVIVDLGQVATSVLVSKSDRK